MISLVIMAVASCNRTTGLSYDSLAAPLPTPGRAVGVGFRVQVGDNIDVFVLEDSTFNGAFTVRPSGDIIMPKVGRVAVLGLTLAEVEGRIKATLEANQLKSASVIVDPGNRGEVAYGGMTLRMSGEIAQTGRVTVKPIGGVPTSAYQAVVDSGGFKPFAHRRKAYILRKTPSGVLRIPVNFEAVEAGKADDPIVMEGDCIVVPRKVFGF